MGYRDCLSNFDTFTDWTLEYVSMAIKRRTQAKWIDSFIDRYLNFDKLLVA